MGKKTLISANDDYCINLTHEYARCSEAVISNSPTSDRLLCNVVSYHLPCIYNISTMHIPPLVKIMTHITRLTRIMARPTL